jgi:hypothetical protein
MRPLNASALAAAVLLLSACADDRTSLLPSAPRLTTGVTPSDCAPGQIKTDARAYFSAGGDEIFGIVNDLDRARRDGRVADADNKAFDGLARIATARTTSGATKGTASQGATVASGLIACISTIATAERPTAANLTASLSAGGLFAVRGGTATDRTPVFVYGGTAEWGLQPVVSWADASSARRLFYAYPLSVGNGIDVNVTPASAAVPPKVIVGRCVASVGTQRIEHNYEDVLAYRAFDCPTTRLYAATPAPEGALSTALRTVGRLLLPTEAHAAALLASGMGGLSGSWSPFTAEEIGALKVSITAQPIDGLLTNVVASNSGVVEVTVLRGDGTTPMKGAKVEIVVTGNSGSFTPSGTTAYTDADGVAHFTSFKLDKAGGYTFAAKASFAETVSGTATAITGPTSATSDLFNLKNK